MPCPLLREHLHGVSSTPDRRQHQAAQFGSSPSAPTKQTVGERVFSIPGQLVGQNQRTPVAATAGKPAEKPKLSGNQANSWVHSESGAGCRPDQEQWFHNDAVLTRTQSVSTQGPLIGSRGRRGWPPESPQTEPGDVAPSRRKAPAWSGKRNSGQRRIRSNADRKVRSAACQVSATGQSQARSRWA